MRVKITSANLDFNNGLASQDEDVDALTRTADVLLVQEARDTDLRAVLNKGWHTNQVNSTAGTRGSAVCWSSRLERRHGRLALGATGKGLNARYLSIQRLRVDGKTVRFISVHFPPLRYRFLQPGYAAVLVAVIKASKTPTVVGGDFNSLLSRDPWNLVSRTGLVKRFDGIDGFLVSKSLLPSQITHEAINSDHDAVSISIKV